jgi:hypothetical protein
VQEPDEASPSSQQPQSRIHGDIAVVGSRVAAGVARALQQCPGEVRLALLTQGCRPRKQVGSRHDLLPAAGPNLCDDLVLVERPGDQPLMMLRVGSSA